MWFGSEVSWQCWWLEPYWRLGGEFVVFILTGVGVVPLAQDAMHTPFHKKGPPVSANCAVVVVLSTKYNLTCERLNWDNQHSSKCPQFQIYNVQTKFNFRNLFGWVFIKFLFVLFCRGSKPNINYNYLFCWLLYSTVVEHSVCWQHSQCCLAQYWDLNRSCQQDGHIKICHSLWNKFYDDSMAES